MKKHLAILLLFTYAAVLVKPYCPVINYLFHKEYISAVLCENKDKPMLHCNGKCHMIKEMKKAGDEESKSNLPSSRTSAEDFTTVTAEAGSMNMPIRGTVSTINTIYTLSFTSPA